MMLLFKLFITFFKIGLFTFGGGYAMIPMISDEVIAAGWTTQQMLTDFIAISESTPGTFAINVATFIGMEQMGVVGAIAATLGVILPSFIIILIIAKFFVKASENKYFKSFLWGVRPVVVGLIMAATFSIAQSQLVTTTIFNTFGGFMDAVDWRAVGIFVCVFIISKLKKLHPIWYIMMAGAAGAVLYGVL